MGASLSAIADAKTFAFAVASALVAVASALVMDHKVLLDILLYMLLLEVKFLLYMFPLGG